MNNVDRERLLRDIVRLRQLELDGAPDAVADVREDIEGVVGRTIPRAMAARVLGITQTALDRHIERGLVVAVETPSGRREVPIPEVVSLAIEQREHAATRYPTSAALRTRAAVARRLDLIVPPTTPASGHGRAERIALLMHVVIATRLDGQLVRDARRRLRRWQRAGTIDARHALRWMTLLDLPEDELRAAISRDDVTAAELRQTSPFAGALNAHERRRVIELATATP